MSSLALRRSFSPRVMHAIRRSRTIGSSGTGAAGTSPSYQQESQRLRMKDSWRIQVDSDPDM